MPGLLTALGMIVIVYCLFGDMFWPKDRKVFLQREEAKRSSESRS
ncbi:MAG: hypothetical protein US35_C0021G0006 [Parcubacteria group bacterium GW2011_GWA2_37_10]|nr:MAG: hypothetical protein US35_C0021G0006 [Parcubacteria group bacterium GW2011_GWA2_37_10]